MLSFIIFRSIFKSKREQKKTYHKRLRFAISKNFSYQPGYKQQSLKPLKVTLKEGDASKCEDKIMALDFYVQIDGIDGQSNDKGHSKWIEAIAFSHGAKQQIASERATSVAGRGVFEEFAFVHEVDKATPKIQQFCMSGQKIDKVKIEVCSAVAGIQTPVYEVTLEQVKIIGAHIEAGAGEQPPVVERVSLAAGKATWKATAIKPDGSKDGAVEANFNQIENA